MPQSEFQFNISLSVLNHLGRNLYRNFITVLGEAISNSWDSDAKNVWIDIDKKNNIFSIKDDGGGMTANGFQNKFLKIGYSKRKNGKTETRQARPYLGAKGIGKLALLSCAERVSIFTKTSRTEYVGGVIDNVDLDEAIQDDVTPSDYPLEDLDYGLIKNLSKGHKQGTILVFEKMKDKIRTSEEQLKKLLAMHFWSSLFGDDFNIYVNGNLVTINDLKSFMDGTQFIWVINSFESKFIKNLENLEAKPKTINSKLKVRGFVATVKTPAKTKISGTDERVTLDLFVNGRLREKNVLKHIPTRKLVESYLYGQIHFDLMDRKEKDPFTSSREGVVEDDEHFQSLLALLKNDVLPKVIDQWDGLRSKRGELGDDQNKRKTVPQRRARELYNAISKEFRLDSGSPERGRVDGWMKELMQEAEVNIPAYADCFLSENLVRRYISEQNMPLSKNSEEEIKKYKNSEFNQKRKADIAYAISQNNNDLNYLGMRDLAKDAEGRQRTGKGPSLLRDAIRYTPVRNAVCHTSLLSETAKKDLNVIRENIRAQIKQLLSGGK